MLNYKEIGAKIRQKRKALNLTQLQLAEKVELTESSISRYESGKIATMPTSTVNKICKVLKIEPAELLGITPENSFEYDLKEILKEVDNLPVEAKKELLNLFKSQINMYRRLSNEKDDNVSKEIKK
jgi:transcriptional regulator with XRE-family HTH domain